jgi:polyhydroxybutyrate depolymerase
MHTMARERGYAIVFPDGTAGELLSKLRTWNAGGGVDDWRCVSGDACERGIDDIAYVRALIEDVSARISVDEARIFVTGLSNGGAMSHRLACEASDVIAAIAPIGGGLQRTVEVPCAPSRPVPVLQIHGTADTCWRYEGGEPDCVGGITGQPGKRHVSVQRTLDDWAAVNGCAGATEETAIEDRADDGTSTTRVTYLGCAADLEHLRIEGGGHTWPMGDQYLAARTIGPVTLDWGNELLFEWFDAHPMP